LHSDTKARRFEWAIHFPILAYAKPHPLVNAKALWNISNRPTTGRSLAGTSLAAETSAT